MPISWDKVRHWNALQNRAFELRRVGHCLLVPLPGSLVGPLFTNVQTLSRAVELGLNAGTARSLPSTTASARASLTSTSTSSREGAGMASEASSRLGSGIRMRTIFERSRRTYG